jgi:hypothetical protein
MRQSPKVINAISFCYNAHDDGQVKTLSMDDAPCWESRSPCVKKEKEKLNGFIKSWDILGLP